MHRTFNVVIEGIAPLIQDNPAEADLAQLTGKKKRSASKQDESECWRSKIYKDSDGILYHPARAFESLVQDAAKNFKGKGRASMATPIRQCCWVEGEKLIITNRKKPDEVMVNTPQGMSGRIPSYLPVFSKGWRMAFEYQLTDDEIVTPDHLHEIITWGGQRIGIGKKAFRPKFGRFMIVKFEEVDAKQTQVA
jgi:hypothetical protein